MIRFLSILLLLAFAGLSQGQQLKVVKVADDSFVAFEIDAAGAYKFIGSYKSLEIIGGKTPDPPVPPPTPKTSGVAYLIVMRPDQPTESQAASMMLLRQWVDSQPVGKAEMLELTKDQRDSSGGADRRVAGYVALIPQGEQLPYVFLIQAKTDGSGNFTHWRGQLDGNHAAIIERTKGVMR